jgi:teichoic acid transport system permease protein
VNASPTVDAELARYAASHGLAQLGGRPPLTAYIKELWVRRHFAFELARSKVRSQNEQDRLGIGWVILTPLINALVYGLIFGLLLASQNRPDNFVAFLVCGVFTFAFFSGSFSDGAKSIIGNRGLVRTLHFPRAVLPMATVLQKLLELCAQVVVMVAIVLATGEPPSWRWLMIVPVFVIMSLFCAGVAFFAARLTIHVRDIAQLIPFITRLIFYVSGIFFVVGDRLSKSPELVTLLRFNPLNVYITLVRDSLLTRTRLHDGIGADEYTWLIGIGWALAMFVLGFVFFWRAEGLYGRD